MSTMLRSFSPAAKRAARRGQAVESGIPSRREPVSIPAQVRLEQFDYALPAERIATEPAVPRDAARLLLSNGNALEDRRVSDLPALLDVLSGRPGSP